MMCILLLKTIGEQDLQLILNVGNKKNTTTQRIVGASQN
jgi:hypothetical protein